MNETGSNSWWLSNKTRPDSSTQLISSQLAPSQSTPQPQPAGPAGPARTSIWSWKNTDDLTSTEPHDNGTANQEILKTDDSYWWWWSRVLSSTGLSNDEGANKLSPEHKEIDESTSNGWFLWFLSQQEQTADLESDVEDQSTAELFREAKLALETSRDSCHYAISGHYGTKDVELSVSGTSSAVRPVKYNHKKKPTVAHEYFEKSIAHAKVTRNNSPPIYSSSEQKVDTSRNGWSNGNRKTLSSSTQLQQMAVKQPTNEIMSSNSSIRSGKNVANENDFSVVLPDISENFRVITLSTKLRLFGEAMLYGDKTSEKHLYSSTKSSISSKKKRVSKKAVVISLHSFLPTKFVKLIIGQSTGNSKKFAEQALEALRSWLDEKYARTGDIQIISLEGFGTIESRVQHSYELLKTWALAINEADFVFFVSNSIASPTALLLVQKLVETKTFDLSNKKVGLLSIAGALSGPYIGLDTKVVIRAYTQSENEIINELFELQKPTSAIRSSLQEAFQCLCANNVKITLAGSISDQFVPLCSSLGQHVSHPNIYRCIYVNESSEVPTFITRLISIVLTMENVGHGDHSLLWFLLEIIQVATQVNGSHGSIHDDDSVYEAGIRFALETTSVRQRRDTKETLTNFPTGDMEKNLYHLPWCVRGLLNDMMHIKHIHNLTLLEMLQKHYLAWEPITKHWRNVKHCFAAFEDLTVEDILL